MTNCSTNVPPVPGRTRTLRRGAAGLLLLLTAALVRPAPAEAQLDPLLMLKRSQPTVTEASYRANVLLAVDTAPRMQFDADGNYYDPAEYTRGNFWDSVLGVTPANTAWRYRRLYRNLQPNSSGPQKWDTSTIAIAGDLQGTAYSRFYARSRIGVAKEAMAQAVEENFDSVRFGLMKMRQNNPRVLRLSDEPVWNADPNQQTPSEFSSVGYWKLSRGRVDGDNQSIETLTAPMIKPDVTGQNELVLTTLGKTFAAEGALLPAGHAWDGVDDAPLAHLLVDARAEAARLIAADTAYQNTVVVLLAGGGEGTGGHSPDAASIASTFLGISGAPSGESRRVPIYVIALAPDPAALAELESIAANSGGRFFHVTRDEIEAAAAAGVAVPKVVRALNLAVQHGFADPSDVNAAPTASLPYGPRTEHQVTSPVIGTVDLAGATDINGVTLPLTGDTVTNAQSGAVIPQRANVMVTAGFAIPDFEASLRAFRVYKPVPDSTRPSGYRFESDGTAVWVARTPMETYCPDTTASCRNIFTALPDGSVVPFTVANLSLLSPHLNTPLDPAGLINFVRTQPLGAIVGATPAFMDPPSLDPPPDSDYPAYLEANEDRRSIIFVGANDGMLHAIDSRTGVEIWAFIPYNLLPKLRTLRDGQSVDSFDYFVDSSVKVADVKIGGQWKTTVIVGEGAGGTFYQAFDATLEGLGDVAPPDTDAVSSLLNHFADPSRIGFLWSFPRYSKFDVTLGEYGDLDASASDAEKSVGQTWSDPAVGQVGSPEGKYTVITGSGFFPRSSELAANRNGASAGRALYLLDAADGAGDDGIPFDWMVPSPASDGLAEDDDNCVDESYGCTMFKNALQADPVATGPSDSRYISKAYVGDLDGNVWRFDIDLSGTQDADGQFIPRFSSAPVNLNPEADPGQPIFASMASVAIGTDQYLFFGTGSDLLPSRGVDTAYRLVGLLDEGGSGTITFSHDLARVDGLGDDEMVSSFPAVAGDIVFFSTSSFKPETPWLAPDANLYALTFIGGAAYDSSGNDVIDSGESPKVRTLAGAGRATAPFIVDQHVVFGAGDTIEMFGDPTDFNNGVGQVGVRILSWRELR